MDTRIWGVVGVALVMLGLITYWWMYYHSRGAFNGMSSRQILHHLVSHVPNDDASPLPHIFAGVNLILGSCLLISSAVASMHWFRSQAEIHSLALSVGGLAFGVLISTISFWTLWQTRRIEQLQGSVIDGFPDLIEVLATAIERQNEDLRVSGFQATDYHRLFVVSTNPFFGQLSYSRDLFTQKFKDSLLHAAAAHRHSQETAGNEFKFEILCGDSEAISRFHREFFKSRDVLAAEDDARVVEANDAVERQIGLIEEEADNGTFTRIRRIPRTQFAVVGNTVFEFILENPGYQTEIYRARRIQEKVVCDRFVETFDILKLLVQPGSAANPATPAHSAPPGGGGAGR